MFGALKRLFSKSAQPEPPQATPAQPQPVKATAPAASVAPASARTQARAAAQAEPGAATPATGADGMIGHGSRRGDGADRATPETDAGEMIRLPLAPIVAGLPPNLAGLVVSAGGGAFALPVKTALAQLATGAVRVPFGQLRRGSPPGVFADNASQDNALVSLPLPQILASLDPALLARRPGQKVATVPESVTSIFGKVRPFSAKTMVNPEAFVAPEPATKGSAQSPAPAHPPAAPIAPLAPVVLAAPQPAASAPAPLHAPKPAAPLPGASPFARQPTTQSLPTSLPKPPASAPRLPSLAKPPGAAAQPSSAPKTPSPAVMPFAQPKTPAMPAPAPASPAAEQESLGVKISALMQAWPAPVRQEIEQHQLGGASVSLPVARLDSAMRTGRVVFTWGELCQWLQPPPTANLSAHRETPLELPLGVIAPLFMARRRPGAGQKQVAVAPHIPDLFAGAARTPEAAPAAPAPAVPAAASAVSEPVAAVSAPVAATSAAAVPEAAAAGGLGEIFGEPGKSAWSPQEIVEKICALPGVAGSVLAMSDGLLMAGRLPAPFRPETVAAFMPQIVGRVSQYAAEMQLGAVTGVLVAAGRGPCAMCKAGKLYLAVLGRAGEALPEAMIGRIAAELARRNS